MTTARFIKSNIEDWTSAKRIAINKKSIAGSPNVYISIKTDSTARFLLEVYSDYRDSCFQSRRVVKEHIIIGYGEHVHFFNTISEQQLSIELAFYFCDMYVAEDLGYQGDDFGVLVTSAERLHRFTVCGWEIWTSSQLGIDGVTVLSIENNNIIASGEWDPPGGWIDVTINLDNGEEKKLKESGSFNALIFN